VWRWQRRPRAETGAFAGEYIGLGVLAAVVVAVLAMMVPGGFRAGAATVVCRIVHAGGGGTGDGCGAPPPRPRCTAFCPTTTNPIHPSDPVTAATKGGYAALGDSYASGEGANGNGAYLPGSETGADHCHRAPSAFPRGMSTEFHFRGGQRFVACSGARTPDIAGGRYGEPSQYDALNQGTTTVTLTVGGNDIGFAPVVKACLLDLHISLKFWDPPKQDVCHSKGKGIDDEMARLFGHPPDPSRYERMLEEIHRRAPNARILVSGYPRMFPEPPKRQYLTLRKDDQEFLNRKTAELNAQIARQVQAEDQKAYGGGEQMMGGFEYVDTYNALDGHEITTPKPWINGVEVCLGGLTRGNPNCRGNVGGGAGTFHPTPDGQRAFERVFARQLREGPGRVLYDP
jgi:hypothetical protein